LEGDLFFDVTVVVDVDLVEDIIPELVEVRSGGRIFETDEVGHDVDHVRVLDVSEQVDVGVVRHGVLADQRGLSMAGGLGRRRCQHAPSGEDHCQ
jgi:hypothetical protein